MSIVNFHPTVNCNHSDFDSDILVQDMVDLLGNKISSLSKTRGLVCFSIDLMDNSLTDSVKADFFNDIVYIFNDTIILDISGSNPVDVPITTDLIDLSTDQPNDNAYLIDLNFDDSNINLDMGKLDDDHFSDDNFKWQSEVGTNLIDLPVDQSLLMTH
jgi:hypothetical protein